jgi:hypothetical protein
LDGDAVQGYPFPCLLEEFDPEFEVVSFVSKKGYLLLFVPPSEDP